MKVTNNRNKDSQLPKEGSLQKDSAEHEGYAGVYDSSRITENNITNANESKEGLLERNIETETT